ncbi:TetR/AcrR family transcriptional regulator [Corynebacterium sp. zg-331]|uniref:TetR/AcrR family transcriptional regulator n=1 Tax=unclassified Corynebacterium TaxID=2624378 RepID=UPI00128E8576|nr:MULTISPECIES: TetR/AcrR family transcriptional regulator [unclassified Corynebacterium]MBC3185816.1 TetR/AcrR family transcriptional regulator [Corynebacterium sp. zg-331]MPV52308.1 TetR family transcriptional regulator [Corynebacterium sp. zg331]
MPQPDKKTRRDARANRDAILAVARDEFSAHGFDVSMDKVAKAAGVGSGTLYRHFPNREALFGAVLEGCAPQVEQEGRRLARIDDAAQAVREWLRIIVRWSRSFEGASAPMNEAIATGEGPLAATCADLLGTLERLLGAAQASGVINAEISARDLYSAVLGIAWAGEDDDAVERLLRMLEVGWRCA